MAIRKLETSNYEVDVSYTKLNGKYGRKKKKNISTLKEAKLIEAEFIAVYKQGEVRDLKLKNAIDQFLDYKKVRVKETHIIKTITLMNLVEDLWDYNIEKITPTHIAKLQKSLIDKQLSTTYINECLNRLYSVFEFSRNFNNTKNNPCEKVERLKNNKPKNNIDFWTYEEFELFDNAITDSLEWKTFFNLLYFTGIRKGEAQALNWKDIDFETKLLSISKNLTFRTSEGLYKITTPKTINSNRVITVPDKVIELLKQLKIEKSNNHKFKDDHFIFGYPDTPIHDSTLTRRKNKYCDLAGIKQIKIHDFRHSHASLLINNDVNILVVCQRLGHADIKMTLNTYSHMFKTREDEALQFLNNL